MLKFWLVVMAYLLAVNIVSVLAFYRDKRMAVNEGRRLRESTLLFLALIGGGFGAKYAQHMFRHKTRKQPFKAMLNLIVVLNIVILAALIFPDMRTQLVNIGRELMASDGRNSEPELVMPRRFGPGS